MKFLREAESQVLRENEEVNMERIVAFYREIHDANPGASKTEIKHLFAEAVVNDPDFNKSYLLEIVRVVGERMREEES